MRILHLTEINVEHLQTHMFKEIPIDESSWFDAPEDYFSLIMIKQVFFRMTSNELLLLFTNGFRSISIHF